MSFRESARRRPRRIAADEAHAWARNLRLKNHQAKLVVCMLTLYVDGDGFCFVSIPALADDTELSDQTVRRRLVWLEEIGAIARLPQWLDTSGRRNGDGRGKRTSDLIKLLIDADVDAISDRACGGHGGVISPSSQQGLIDDDAGDDACRSTFSPTSQIGLNGGSAEFSPGSQQGLNSVGPTVSPTVALPQPCHSSQGLISEPEPESSPLPPSRGCVPEDWKDFENDWQEPILRQSFAIQEWNALSPADRQTARRAARGYVIWRGRQHKPPNVIGAHLFLRERSAWAGFVALVPDAGHKADPEGVWIAEGSDCFRALEFLRHLARVPAPFVRAGPDGSRGYYRNGEVGADVLAMLEFADQSVLRWDLIPRGAPQFAAWQRRFVEWVGKPRALKIGESGIRVPCPWPPKKDGTIYRDIPADEASTDESAGSDDVIGDDAQYDRQGERDHDR